MRPLTETDRRVAAAWDVAVADLGVALVRSGAVPVAAARSDSARSYALGAAAVLRPLTLLHFQPGRASNRATWSGCACSFPSA